MNPRTAWMPDGFWELPEADRDILWLAHWTEKYGAKRAAELASEALARKQRAAERRANYARPPRWDKSKIEIYPVIGRLCLALGKVTKRGYGRAYRLWSYVEELSRRAGGTEWVEITTADAEIIGADPRTLYRQIKEALQLGFFRSVMPGKDGSWRVYFVAQKRVNRMIGLLADEKKIAGADEIDRRRIAISIEALSSWLAFCGEVFSAWCAITEGSSRMVPGYSEIEGRITLEMLWGRSRQQLLKWRKASPTVTVSKNWGAEERRGDTPHRTARKYSDGQRVNSFDGKRTFAGRYYRYWRRPNTYTSIAERKAIGQARYFAGTSDQPDSTDCVRPVFRGYAQQHLGHSDSGTCKPGEPKPTINRNGLRVNFESERALSKQHEERPDAALYLLVSRKERTWSRMWSRKIGMLRTN